MPPSRPVDEGHARRLDGIDQVPAGNPVSRAHQQHLSVRSGQYPRPLRAVFRIRARDSDERKGRTDRPRGP